MLKLKRVYEKPSREDGFRVLVERLWPRGISKKKATLDLWLKDVAPSPELRKWFNHDPDRWKKFCTRYAAELKTHSESLNLLKGKARRGTVTLVYASKDEKHNNALALKRLLSRSRKKPKATSSK